MLSHIPTSLWSSVKRFLQRIFSRQSSTQYHPEPSAILIEIQDATLIQTDVDFSTERVI